MKKIILLLLAVFSLEASPVKVLVSVPPYAGIVSRIGGDEVEITVLVPKGADPHSFEATPQQAIRASRAEVWFQTGDSFERHLMKLKGVSEGTKLVDLRKGLSLIEVSPGSYDPHIWMSFELLLIQAETIKDHLSVLRPESKSAFEENFQAFKEEVKDYLLKNQKRFAPYRGKILFSDHPAYNYLCRELELTPLSLEEEGKEPTPSQLANVIATVKREKVAVLFSQSQFLSKSVKTLSQELGLKVVTLDPLEEDFPKALSELSDKIWEALNE